MVMVVPQKVKDRIICDLGNPLIAIYPKELRTNTQILA
jgi:hypothetical protein